MCVCVCVHLHEQYTPTWPKVKYVNSSGCQICDYEIFIVHFRFKFVCKNESCKMEIFMDSPLKKIVSLTYFSCCMYGCLELYSTLNYRLLLNCGDINILCAQFQKKTLTDSVWYL